MLAHNQREDDEVLDNQLPINNIEALPLIAVNSHGIDEDPPVVDVPSSVAKDCKQGGVSTRKKGRHVRKLFGEKEGRTSHMNQGEGSSHMDSVEEWTANVDQGEGSSHVDRGQGQTGHVDQGEGSSASANIPPGFAHIGIIRRQHADLLAADEASSFEPMFTERTGSPLAFGISEQIKRNEYILPGMKLSFRQKDFRNPLFSTQNSNFSVI